MKRKPQRKEKKTLPAAGFFLCVCFLFLFFIPVQASTLKINIKGEPATLDPRKGGDAISATLQFLLFEGLTRMHPDGSITPAQAEIIDISEDKKTYTFHLRKTFWSDGSPVTAFDFESAWKEILNPSFPSVNAHLLYVIKNAEAAKKGAVTLDTVGIKAANAKTLIVELENPTPYFLDLTAFCVFFPVKHTLVQKYPDWAAHAKQTFVSNGPFLLSEWKHNQRMLLRRNPSYWQNNEVTLGNIQISMIDNELTTLQMYEKKELDLIDMWISPIPLEALPALYKKGILTMRPIGGSTICTFNTTDFPFSNAHIRKAFALAIHRQEIVANITQLGELPALSAIPPVLYRNNLKNRFLTASALPQNFCPRSRLASRQWSLAPDKNSEEPPCQIPDSSGCFGIKKQQEQKALFKDGDVITARKYLELGLKELGITKAQLSGLTYTYSSSERNHKIAQALQQQWLNVLGVQVNLQNCEYKILLDKLTKRTYSFAQTQWFAQYHDPMNFLERFKSKDNVKNYPGWESKAFQKLLTQAVIERDNRKREDLLERAEQLLIEEMPLTPLYHWNSALLIQPYLKNVHIFNMGNPDYTRIIVDTPSEN